MQIKDLQDFATEDYCNKEEKTLERGKMLGMKGMRSPRSKQVEKKGWISEI